MTGDSHIPETGRLQTQGLRTEAAVGPERASQSDGACVVGLSLVLQPRPALPRQDAACILRWRYFIRAALALTLQKPFRAIQSPSQETGRGGHASPSMPGQRNTCPHWGHRPSLPWELRTMTVPILPSELWAFVSIGSLSPPRVSSRAA